MRDNGLGASMAHAMPWTKTFQRDCEQHLLLHSQQLLLLLDEKQPLVQLLHLLLNGSDIEGRLTRWPVGATAHDVNCVPQSIR